MGILQLVLWMSIYCVIRVFFLKVLIYGIFEFGCGGCYGGGVFGLQNEVVQVIYCFLVVFDIVNFVGQ